MMKIPRLAALLETDRGRCFLRVGDASQESISFQLELIGSLSKARLPTPAPLSTSHGGLAFEFRGFRGYLTEAATGAPFTPGSRAQLASAGEILARFHLATAAVPIRFAGPWRGRPSFDVEIRGSLPQVRDRLARLAERFSAHDFRAALRVVDSIDSRVAGFSVELSKGIIHGDFRCDNLFFNEDHVSAIFDFDWAGYSEPLRDLCWAAINFNQWSAERVLNSDESRSVVDSYLKIRQCSPSESRLLPIGIAWYALDGLSAIGNRIENGLIADHGGLTKSLEVLRLLNF